MSARETAVKMTTAGWGLARSGASKLRGDRDQPEAWNSRIIDDIADNRPWNLVCKAARFRARLRLGSLEDGVTVVIVNWNTLGILTDVIDDVRRLSPPSTRILIVDNASKDGSREYLSARTDIATMFLPFNIGHAPALDLAMYVVRTKVAVTLDSDAFPLGEHWLDQAVDPVRTGEAVLAGLRSSRGFVHPVFSALDVATFVRRRLSFQMHKLPSVASKGQIWGENAFDCAELMTRRLDPSVVKFVDPTPNRSPGLPGMSVGDVVYHHGGVTRLTSGGVDETALGGWIHAREALGVTSST